ncbi:hypothetical protein AO501_25155 [Mycobacterium gordonae]|uniref:Uncharacterized protein n=1 Tax=Mycobacterium gordonae TaxID=1778 RepID=A0A0Q2U4B9_MYCGO|nr:MULTISPECIES: hypothetical protein [Mycobacterium]KQH75568.1 hypothetical protein AO501_25155 [Mycobacterium gordonae]MDP7732119.1 hypothetical protein [Mycobacterium sp. TY813]
MTNLHFAAALFPQHTKAGADALLTAADNAAAETARLQHFRTQVAELLGIPANAEDTFILNELDHLCRRAEECQHDHQGARNG